MSVFLPITSALPPGADVPGKATELPLVTQCGLRVPKSSAHFNSPQLGPRPLHPGPAEFHQGD
jgi:hypothetical protein